MGLFTSTPSVSADEAAQLHADNDAVLLDVREPVEWKQGRASGALHIPMGELANRADEIPTDKPIVVVCRSGNRSATVTKALIKANSVPETCRAA